MSDGIVTAIITTSGTILIALIGFYFKRKKDQEKQANLQNSFSNSGSISRSVINVNTSPVGLPLAALVEDATPKPQTGSITEMLIEDLRKLEEDKKYRMAHSHIAASHKEICDTIEAVKPFHQAKVAEGFIGKRVTWHTNLKGVSHSKDVVSISAAMPEGMGLLLCRAKPENAELFIVAVEGTKFIVTGEIEKISRYSAELSDCIFQIAKDD